MVKYLCGLPVSSVTFVALEILHANNVDIVEQLIC